MAFDKAASRLLTYAIRIDNSIFLNVFCRSMLSKYFASQRSVASPEDCKRANPMSFLSARSECKPALQIWLILRVGHVQRALAVPCKGLCMRRRRSTSPARDNCLKEPSLQCLAVLARVHAKLRQGCQEPTDKRH